MVTVSDSGDGKKRKFSFLFFPAATKTPPLSTDSSLLPKDSDCRRSNSHHLQMVTGCQNAGNPRRHFDNELRFMPQSSHDWGVHDNCPPPTSPLPCPTYAPEQTHECEKFWFHILERGWLKAEVIRGLPNTD